MSVSTAGAALVVKNRNRLRSISEKDPSFAKKTFGAWKELSL